MWWRHIVVWFVVLLAADILVAWLVRRRGPQDDDREDFMPRFLEEKLKKEYPNNPSAVYGTMNRLGYMHGNKETSAGRAAQAKHERDARKPAVVVSSRRRR